MKTQQNRIPNPGDPAEFHTLRDALLFFVRRTLYLLLFFSLLWLSSAGLFLLMTPIVTAVGTSVPFIANHARSIAMSFAGTAGIAAAETTIGYILLNPAAPYNGNIVAAASGGRAYNSFG